MANTIEIIIKATDQASTVIDKVEASAVASSAVIVKGFDGVGTAADAVDKKLGEYGAALDEVTREQNKLKQAQYDAQDAAQKLAKAQKDLKDNTDPKRTEELNRALADAQVNLDKAGAEVQKLSKDLREGKSATDEAKGAFSGMQATIITVNQAMQAMSQAVGIAKGIYDSTLGSVIQYGAQVKDLSTTLSLSAEETSKLISIGEKFGVSTETLTRSLEMMTKRGMAPSLDGLAKLADRIMAIKDPVQRAAQLSEIFGRGWVALMPILEKGGAAIRSAGDEAARFGKVLSTEDVDAVEALGIATNTLGERFDGLKAKLLKGVIPGLIIAADDLGYMIDKSQGLVTPLEDAKRTLDRVTAAFGENSPATAKAREEYEKLKQPIEAVSQSMDEKLLRSNMKWLASLGTVQTSLSDLERGIRNQAGVYAVLDAVMDKTTAKSNLLASSQTLIATEMTNLKTVMAGALKNEDQQYSNSQAELQKRLKETADELKNLEGAQGSVDKSTVKNAMSAAELTKAHVDLAAAQARLAKETDPMKQQQLAASIAVQAERISGANQAVVTYVNNSKKIAELRGQYDEINKEIEANAKAHEEATRRILFGYAEQQLAVGGLTETEIEALDALAVRWGLKSEEDVKAMKAIREAALGLAKDNNINEFVGNVDRAAGKAGTSFNAISTAAGETRKAIENAGIPIEIPLTPKTDTASKTAFQNAAQGYVTNAVPVPLTPKTDPAAQTAFQNTAQGYITHPVEVPVNAKPGTVDTKTAIGAAGIPIDVPVTPKLTPEAGAAVNNQVKGFFPGGIPLPIVPKIDPADRTKIGHDLAGDLKFSQPTIKPKLDYVPIKQDFSKLFNLPEVKKIQEPFTMLVKADTTSAIMSMQYFNSYGLSPAITYYDALIARAYTFSTLVGQTPTLPALPGTPTTTTPTTTPTRPPGTGPAEFAAGADFIVPPGYPGDSFPMRVSSGERVQVTPAGQGGGGNLPPINITQTFNGAQSSPEQYRSIMYEVITDVFDKAMRQ